MELSGETESFSNDNIITKATLNEAGTVLSAS